MSSYMTAGALLNSMISWYLGHFGPDTGHRGPVADGHWEMLLHATEVTRGLSGADAAEWLAEELQDRFSATAD